MQRDIEFLDVQLDYLEREKNSGKKMLHKFIEIYDRLNI